MPTLPKKLSELDIEGDWRSTNDGKDFLLGIYTKLFKLLNYIILLIIILLQDVMVRIIKSLYLVPKDFYVVFVLVI